MSASCTIDGSKSPEDTHQITRNRQVFCVNCGSWLAAGRSWLHNFIFQPFAANEMGFAGKNGDKRIRIIDNEIKGYFMSRYCTSMKVEDKRKQIWVNEYFFLPTGEIEGSVEGKLNNCPAHVIEELKQKKNEFFKHGFATYQDAAYLSFLLLKKHGYIAPIIAGRFPFIIIDVIDKVRTHGVKTEMKTRAST
jgi:DNA helicase-2/ATP-dependent DNA helicase PcrA